MRSVCRLHHDSKTERILWNVPCYVWFVCWRLIIMNKNSKNYKLIKFPKLHLVFFFFFWLQNNVRLHRIWFNETLSCIYSAINWQCAETWTRKLMVTRPATGNLYYQRSRTNDRVNDAAAVWRYSERKGIAYLI